MKNLFFWIGVSLLFTACDRMHPYVYKVINKTNQSLSVHCIAKEGYSKTDSIFFIEKDSSVIVHTEPSHGAEGYTPYDSPEYFDIDQLKIVNSNLDGINFAERKYWNFINIDDDIGLYTLTIGSSKTITKN